jgi:hypothetical protein
MAPKRVDVLDQLRTAPHQRSALSAATAMARK